MIYFDNAATSLPKPPAVAQAVAEAMATFGGPGRGGHRAALDASRCIFQARVAIAQLLGSAPERTIFTSNATESLNLALNGLLTPQDHVITTVLEHNSVLRPLYRLVHGGMGLSFVDTNGDGTLNYGGFRQNLRPNTRAVVCTHASNLTGAVTDLAFLSAFCKEHNLLLIVDAAQTAGVFPIDADGMGIDVLCFTGHKNLFGPQGTGGLCIRDGLAISPLKVGGSGMLSFSQAHPKALPEALEAGTLNAHGIAGLLAGVQYVQQTGLDTIRNQELALANRFREGISAIPGVQIYGNALKPHAPIVSINIGDADSGSVADLLASRYDICVRSGGHCAPLAHMAQGTQEQGAVRFGFSHFNTVGEIDLGIQAVAELAAEIGADR